MLCLTQLTFPRPNMQKANSQYQPATYAVRQTPMPSVKSAPTSLIAPCPQTHYPVHALQALQTNLTTAVTLQIWAASVLTVPRVLLMLLTRVASFPIPLHSARESCCLLLLLQPCRISSLQVPGHQRRRGRPLRHLHLLLNEDVDYLVDR